MSMATEVIKGLEHLSFEAEFWDCAVWSKGGSRVLTNMYKDTMGGNEEEGSKLFSVVPSDRAGGSGYKLKAVNLDLNTRKLTVSVIKHYKRLSGEVVESPSVEILKTCLGNLL